MYEKFAGLGRCKSYILHKAHRPSSREAHSDHGISCRCCASARTNQPTLRPHGAADCCLCRHCKIGDYWRRAWVLGQVGFCRCLSSSRVPLRRRCDGWHSRTKLRPPAVRLVQGAMVMHVYACCRDDSTALRWLKPDMAIVVGDLGEENEQLAQAMVQGLTEAQVTAGKC